MNNIVAQTLAQQKASFGLYVHIPFCERKCPYCDFNTYAGLQPLFQQTVDALCAEIERWRQPLQGRTITTVFLGGGTPTVLNDAQLGQLFACLRRCFAIDRNAEITSEANPGAVDRAKFVTLRQLGVNRLSLGVQSLQADELSFLGRIHDVSDVYRAVDAAHSAGFDNLNLDFMFGLPGQSLADWTNSLEQALSLAPQHLSLYSLIVEPNTPLAHWVSSGQAPPPDEDEAADHYERAIEMLAKVGYIQYEVSNWAKLTDKDKDAMRHGNDEAHATPSFACDHNLIYWRNFEYLGIGPGAHSHLRLLSVDDGTVIDRRWGNRKAVPGYIQRIQRGDSVEDFHEIIAEATAMGETMMLGLRLLQEGVPYNHFQSLHHVDLRQIFSKPIHRLKSLGLLESDERRLRLTPRGLMVGNQIFMEFIP